MGGICGPLVYNSHRAMHISMLYGRADLARHMTGWHLPQEARVRNTLDDVASDTWPAL
jgi:hypothetical protein